MKSGFFLGQICVMLTTKNWSYSSILFSITVRRWKITCRNHPDNLKQTFPLQQTKCTHKYFVFSHNGRFLFTDEEGWKVEVSFWWPPLNLWQKGFCVTVRKGLLHRNKGEGTAFAVSGFMFRCNTCNCCHHLETEENKPLEVTTPYRTQRRTITGT
jgi:hypothetical protein